MNRSTSCILRMGANKWSLPFSCAPQTASLSYIIIIIIECFHVCFTFVAKYKKLKKQTTLAFHSWQPKKTAKAPTKTPKFVFKEKQANNQTKTKQQSQDKQTYKKISLTQSYTMTRVNIPQNDLSIRRCRRNQMRTRL